MSPRIPIDREKVEAFCKKWKIVELSLFGSVIRDDFREDSDVDVLVSWGKDASKSFFKHVEAEEELAAIMGRKVDLVTKEGIEKQDNWIRKKLILDTAHSYFPENVDHRRLFVIDPKEKSRLTDECRVLDVYLAMKKALKYCTSKTSAELETNEMETDAILFKLITIGERMNSLSSTYMLEHPEINWDRLKDMRERVTHNLRDTQYPALWNVLTEELPELVKKIEPLIQKESMEPNPELRGFIDAEGRIKSWPGKQSKQFLLLDMLGEKFETGREYSGPEINEILGAHHTFNDPALLRRELINRKILARSADGKVYWKVEVK